MPEIKESFSYTYADKFEIDDYENRHLFLNDIVDEDVFNSLVYCILRWNADDKGLPTEERKPIILYINSPGGSVVDGYGLIDAMLASKTPIITVNQGFAASMGFLIFLAGHKRYSMQHSEFLMHDGSTGGLGSTAKMKDRMEFETNQLEEMTKNYIMGRTSISEELYDNKYRVEWYMLPPEAKSHGIVDCIVNVDCDIDEIV